MSEMLHIVRKDVRRLRWMLVLWLAILAARVALVAGSAALTVDLSPADLALAQLSGPLFLVELLLGALIATRLVHEEPLVGVTAFWLTRPYRRSALLGAKLAVLVAVLVVLPLLADLAMMATLGAGARALAAAGPFYALNYLAAAVSVAVIATLTPSLSALVFTVTGLVAGVVISAQVLAVLIGLIRPPGPPAFTPPQAPDATPGLVMLAVFLCAGLSVVAYQYYRRRWPRGAALAVAGLAATLVAPQIWPWSFARAEGLEPGAWVAEAAAVHDASWGAQVVGDTWRYVSARVTLSDAPPEFTVDSTGVRGRLVMQDGAVVESGQGGGYSVPFRTDAVEAALGGVRLLPPQDAFWQAWTRVIALTEDEFARYRGRSGRIEADVYFQVLRTREVASMPLTAGAAYDDGLTRLEILAVRPEPGAREVTIRQRTARSLMPREAELRRRWLVLRNRARGEALMGTSMESRGTRIPVSFFSLPLPGIRNAGFTATTSITRFPRIGTEGAIAVDAAWFDEAELVVVHTERMGVVTKPLTIENFVIPEN